MEVFVPGRLCLLGEHTDWAAGYRRSDGAAPDIPVGEAVVTGIDQGVYARVARLQGRRVLVYRTTLRFGDEGDGDGTTTMPLDATWLLAEAQSGSPLSYVAGCAYQVLERHGAQVAASGGGEDGVEIDNYRTTLPVKKGLSSSAALSVLVVRSFNRVFGLDLRIEDEMELAYLGETTTPSRCGRLDQACAYGTRPVHMIFDAGRVVARPLALACDLHVVIVDLGASKDTREILRALNTCYPVPRTPVHDQVHRFLGHVSPTFTRQAIRAMEHGDAPALGRLLVQAQAQFDALVAPACPAHLAAPVLHQLLSHPPLQPLILGGKGVGSQGDGTAQLLTKDAAAQAEAMALIEHDFPQMRCLALVLRGDGGRDGPM